MSFEGMDVEQLQGLAKQIDSDAQALDKLVITLTGVVGTLTLLWNGPMAATFEQDWQSKNRPALLAAYDILTSLHTHLVNNISQQTSASAAEGGWTAARDSGGFENFLTGRGFENFLTGEGLVSMALTGTKLMEDTPVGYVDEGLGLISIGIGANRTAHEASDGGYELAQDHYVAAANDFAMAFGDGLETEGGVAFEFRQPEVGAPLYAAGFGIKLIDEEANLAANIDWKDVPSPVSGSNFQQYYVPALESQETWEQASKMLWGMLWGAA
jgi:uncharacterized protein YukE